MAPRMGRLEGQRQHGEGDALECAGAGSRERSGTPAPTSKSPLGDGFRQNCSIPAPHFDGRTCNHQQNVNWDRDRRDGRDGSLGMPRACHRHRLAAPRFSADLPADDFENWRSIHRSSLWQSLARSGSLNDSSFPERLPVYLRIRLARVEGLAGELGQGRSVTTNHGTRRARGTTTTPARTGIPPRTNTRSATTGAAGPGEAKKGHRLRARCPIMPSRNRSGGSVLRRAAISCRRGLHAPRCKKDAPGKTPGALLSSDTIETGAHYCGGSWPLPGLPPPAL